jgi:hypothetical protein
MAAGESLSIADTFKFVWNELPGIDIENNQAL